MFCYSIPPPQLLPSRTGCLTGTAEALCLPTKQKIPQWNQLLKILATFKKSWMIDKYDKMLMVIDAIMSTWGFRGISLLLLYLVIFTNKIFLNFKRTHWQKHQHNYIYIFKSHLIITFKYLIIRRAVIQLLKSSSVLVISSSWENQMLVMHLKQQSV